jgi:hypothetical protein
MTYDREKDIEGMARAICQMHCDNDDNWQLPHTIPEHVEKYWENYRSEATAAYDACEAVQRFHAEINPNPKPGEAFIQNGRCYVRSDDDASLSRKLSKSLNEFRDEFLKERNRDENR